MSAMRIKKIQEIVGAEVDGYFGRLTAMAILLYLNQTIEGDTYTELVKQIQRLLGLKGKDVDGVIGPQTLTKLDDYFSNTLISLPSGASLIISNHSLDKIIQFEISSPSVYRNKYQNPIWPAVESGITIGIGYDLGYVTKSEFKSTWKHFLPETDLKALENVVGLKGNSAKNKLAQVKHVTINYESAKSVFYQFTLGKYAKLVRNIYPKAHLLPPDAQGALLSLVFNRGSSLTGSTRTEMKNIQNHVESKNLSKIAQEIRSMKRLWPNIKGLLSRREEEAILVENANFRILREEQIIV